jgi:hypothetical protein
VLPAKLPPSSSYCLPWHRGAHQQYVASRSPSQTILARPGRLLFFKFQPVGARPLTTLHQPPRTTHPATLHGNWQRRPTAPIDLAVLLTATQDLSVTRPRPCTQRFFIRSSAAADTRTARGTEPPTNPASQPAPETRRDEPIRRAASLAAASAVAPYRGAALAAAAAHGEAEEAPFRRRMR